MPLAQHISQPFIKAMSTIRCKITTMLENTQTKRLISHHRQKIFKYFWNILYYLTAQGDILERCRLSDFQAATAAAWPHGAILAMGV